MDDISQTQARLPNTSSHEEIMDAKSTARSIRKRKEIEEGAIEIDRSPLRDLAAEEFYAEGCTSADVILVHDDEPDTEDKTTSNVTPAVETPVVVELDRKGKGRAVEELMAKSDREAPSQAALFAPLEKADEGFEVWESASAKGDD